jgi:hypothetical protein
VGERGAAVLQHAALRRLYRGVISTRAKQPADAALALPNAAASDRVGEPGAMHQAHSPAVAKGDSHSEPRLEALTDVRSGNKRLRT